MDRKIMVEVSEQELELIKKGALEEKPKELTLGEATIHSLLCELLERIPKQDKVFTEYFDEEKQRTRYACNVKTTYWAETFANNMEEEFSITLLSSSTGIIRKKGEKE